MPVIWRQSGFRFVIYVDDHPPPHVHILADGEMKVNIVGPAGLPHQVYSNGFNVSERRKAMDIVLQRQVEFLAEWDVIHGDG